MDQDGMDTVCAELLEATRAVYLESRLFFDNVG
jgi:hypothetical protein